MSYTKQTWLDGAPGGTPRSAARYNHQEDGIKEASDRLDTVEPALPAPLINAKGDLLAGTANDVITRFALGTDGQVLKVNTATTTGLEWGPDANITDHGDLTGRAADGHSQYHNDARGDVRYYTKTLSDGRYQLVDPDLTALAGITPSADDLIQSKGGSWVNRSPAQVKTDLAVTKSDVGLGNVDNTSDANKPVSNAQNTALGARIAVALIDAKGDLIAGTADNTVARVPIGPDGQVLTADSTASTGVKWATGTAADDLARNIGKAPLLAVDAFTRADGALGTAESGQVWEQQVGSFTVSGQKATSTVNSVALLDVGTSDVDVSCQITVAAAGAPGIVYRAGDTSNRLELRLDTAAGFTLVRLDNAVATTLVSSAQTFTAGQTYHVRMLASNNSLKGFLDGTLRLVVNLAAAGQAEFGTYTKVGLRQPTTQAGILWDNFVVTRSFNDFGGTIAPFGQSANYTLVLTDAGKAVEMDVAAANTCTIPPNSAVPFPIGTVLEIAQVNTGQTTLVAGVGVSLLAPGGALKTRAQYSSVSLRKRATDSWLLAGDLTT